MPSQYHLEFLRFAKQEIPGAVVVNAFAILSTLALLTVAFRVIWLAIAKLMSKSTVDAQSREYIFFNTVLGNYAGCLLIANMINGVAGIMGLHQLIGGGIQEGPYCTTQAIVMQLGNFSGAYFTLAIGIHTFTSLVLARRQSVWICVTTVTIGWLLSGVFAAAPLYRKGAQGPTYGISGLSCGVRDVYPEALFFFHLLPILFTSFLSALLFSFIFLVLRGTLAIRGGLKLTLDPSERWTGSQNYQRFVARIARAMLWFPIAYILFLVPYSVTRLMDLSGKTCPFPLLVAAYVCWFMLGIGNVLSLYNTFRVLGPAFDARSTSQKDLESNTGSKVSSSRVMPPMIAAGEREYSYRPSEAMSEKSRPNSLASFNQVQPRTSTENYVAPFKLKAPPLAARIQKRRDEYTNDQLERTYSRESEASDWTVNTVTVPSFYDYGSTPEIDAPPRPKTRLSQLLLNEPSVDGAPRRVRSTSSRRVPPLSQVEPVQGLPAPPRTVKAQRPVTVLQSPHDSVEIRFSSTSSTSQLDITGWLSEQRPDGYMPHGLISAVGNNHSVPPVPADKVPLPTRSGSLDVARSRSVLATRQQAHLTGSRSRGHSESSPAPQL
ncbi:hypothetical protein DFH07DRAFT_818108 [Mycena maculata]|uniref:Glucose receptor Git3 N-terminal domain-containing protein n=1 Tax=Mycena maculata TaxID=230809 RepID=A0AAD7NG56_9AGAR|nr:hypothetical protein DFH07DRAFT_818108 [Mycena maculata]